LDLAETVRHLRSKGLTYCGRPGKLDILHRLAAEVEASGVPGVFLEAGVAMGGSACVLAKTKRPQRELLLFDVFELLPPPSEKDGPAAQQVYEGFRQGQASTLTDANYLGHAEDLLAYTIQNLREVGIEPERENIKFIKGLYQDTLRLSGPVAFAHIDCDWYESVAVCVERLADRMSPGGVMLFDDYNSFAGCREVVDSWLGHDSRFQPIHADWTFAVKRLPDG
jgi:predicted O-methyltransferase YrrM